MNIAILGTGEVGTALGLRLEAVGHHVIYGSRTPEEFYGAVSHVAAVAGADIVITAVPGMAVLPLLESVGARVLADRIVLDPSLSITADQRLAFPNDSLARHIQERFPRTRVVKTLNTMHASLMVDPLETVPSATVFMSGDDDIAKEIVTSLLNELGWPEASILDLGDITTATGTEHAALLFFGVNGATQHQGAASPV
jgi:predicted dinucleotide-binding enzyme